MHILKYRNYITTPKDIVSYEVIYKETCLLIKSQKNFHHKY